MTKLAVLADIHGNLPALEAVWEDLRQFDVDHVIVAGDLINWGPHSLEVLQFLTERHCAIMRGNHEIYLLDYDTLRAPEVWRRNAGTRLTGPRWIHHQVGDVWRARIATWPDTLCLRFDDAPPVRVVHGVASSHFRGIYADTPAEQVYEMLGPIEETTVVAAHTHRSLDRVTGRWHVVNPGSAGNPFDGILDASYMLLESDGNTWHASHRRVPFNRAAVVEALEEQMLVAEHGDFGRLVIREFQTAEPHVGPYMLWRQQNHPGVPFTESLIDQFSDDLRQEHTFPVNRSGGD